MAPPSLVLKVQSEHPDIRETRSCHSFDQNPSTTPQFFSNKRQISYYDFQEDPMWSDPHSLSDLIAFYYLSSSLYSNYSHRLFSCCCGMAGTLPTLRLCTASPLPEGLLCQTLLMDHPHCSYTPFLKCYLLNEAFFYLTFFKLQSLSKTHYAHTSDLVFLHYHFMYIIC